RGRRASPPRSPAAPRRDPRPRRPAAGAPPRGARWCSQAWSRRSIRPALRAFLPLREELQVIKGGNEEEPTEAVAPVWHLVWSVGVSIDTQRLHRAALRPPTGPGRTPSLPVLGPRPLPRPARAPRAAASGGPTSA